MVQNAKKGPCVYFLTVRNISVILYSVSIAMDTDILENDIIKCGICNDYFHEPTTLPCGHNFCMKCISTQWDQEIYEDVYSCPKCSWTFSTKPELTMNRTLSVIGSKLKRWSLEVQDGVVTELKLNPQPKFKGKMRTKGNVQEMLCIQHEESLTFYCRDDEKGICEECRLSEHWGHDIVPAETGRKEMEQKVKDFLQRATEQVLERELNLKKLSNTVEYVKNSSRTAVEANERVFTELIVSLEKIKSELNKTIQGQTMALLSQIELEQKQQRQAILSLQAVVNDLEIISNLKQDIQFITKSQSILRQQETDPVTINMKENPSFALVVMAINRVRETVDNDCKNEIEIIKRTVRNVRFMKTLEEKPKFRLPPIKPVRRSHTDISGPRPQIPRRQPSQMKTRQDFMKYACPLTLDPDSAHPSMNISEDSTRVSIRHQKKKSFSDRSKNRFDCWGQVMCKEGLRGGRFYWETEWSGTGAFIGMALEGIARKGQGLECGLGHNANSWCLECSNDSYSAWHNDVITNTAVKVSSPRIGIYLDHNEGSLEFYSVSDTMTLIHRFTLKKFSRALYPVFGFGLGLGINSWIRVYRLEY